MKIAFVFLALLMMIVALVANGSGCCDDRAIETFERKMKTLVAELKASCQSSPVATSCKELHETNPSLQSGVYKLMFGPQRIPVYCLMRHFGCGSGGWTPVMKIDGSKSTFLYDSGFWSNKTVYNSDGGATGFDQKETMLPSYWRTPFSRICLGMRVNGRNRFVVINKKASSLHSLIADGQYRATYLGRNKWKTLIGSDASLQRNCNKEGFNAVPTTWRRVRIGFVANNEYHCNNCDSFIGFGSRGDISCGNHAQHTTLDNGYRHTLAMGYILVQ